jgi:hypothetical protein
MLQNKFLKVLQNPLRTLEWIVVLTVLFGVGITLSPLPENTIISSYATLLNIGLIVHILYIGLLAPVLIHLAALIRPAVSWSVRARKYGFMSITIVYTFLSIVRVLNYGLGTPTWSAALGLALISGTLYLTVGKVECRG